jgi:ankyrin repeat protein
MEMAVFYDSIESVRILLDAGVDPNEKKDNIFSPISTATRDNRPEILSLLLSRGADPNLEGQQLPLVMGVRRPAILQQLIAGGAKVSNYKGLLELAVYHDSWSL